MKKGESDLARLKKMIVKDDLRLPKEAFRLLKTEIAGVIDGYFDVEEDTAELMTERLDTGKIGIYFVCVASGAKKVRTMV